jgi:hypothetical protein
MNMYGSRTDERGLNHSDFPRYFIYTIPIYLFKLGCQRITFPVMYTNSSSSSGIRSSVIYMYVWVVCGCVIINPDYLSARLLGFHDVGFPRLEKDSYKFKME